MFLCRLSPSVLRVASLVLSLMCCHPSLNTVFLPLIPLSSLNPPPFGVFSVLLPCRNFTDNTMNFFPHYWCRFPYLLTLWATLFVFSLQINSSSMLLLFSCCGTSETQTSSGAIGNVTTLQIHFAIYFLDIFLPKNSQGWKLCCEI